MRTATAIAPGRVNLIGDHTDYNGGLCLPFAIPLATTATVTVRETPQVLLDGSGDADGSAYVAGVAWALREAGWDVPGLDVAATSDLPIGGGLSSSAALECAVAVAVAGLLDRPLDDAGRLTIAEACRRAETEYVGAPTGGLDQLASMLGREHTAVLIDFADADSPALSDVPLDLAAAGLTILVTDTGVRHALADGDGGYAQRRAECAAGDPRRVRHVHSENARVRDTVAALQQSDWHAAGALLTASHASLRDDYEVSCAELDVTVEAALAGGALGARMTGGGFGGCAIALCRTADLVAVRTAVDAAYDAQGWPAPRHHEVLPAAGARLVEVSPGAPAPR